MSEILDRTLKIIDHVKSDIEKSSSLNDLILPLNALHSALDIMGFRKDNLLISRLALLVQNCNEKNIYNKTQDISEIKNQIYQLISYLIEESKLIDCANHNE